MERFKSHETYNRLYLPRYYFLSNQDYIAKFNPTEDHLLTNIIVNMTGEKIVNQIGGLRKRKHKRIWVVNSRNGI